MFPQLINALPLGPLRWCGILILLAAGSTSGQSIVDLAQQGRWEKVIELASGGADLTAVAPDGMTALHWACWHDNHRAVIALLKAGAPVNQKNHYGITPLSISCLNGNPHVTRDLLQHRADPNEAVGGDESPLMTAARTGNLEVVDLLLESGAKINESERRGQTALMWASAAGHLPVVRRLTAKGAEIHKELSSGFSAMMFAVRAGHKDVVMHFLDQGFDVNHAMRPRQAGGRNVADGTGPLALAIENGHFELAAALLDRGANPNDLRSGFAPLHQLTWVRKPNSGDGLDGQPAPQGKGKMTSLQLVTKLIEAGADVNLRLQRGRSGRGRLKQAGSTPFLMAADTADVPLMRKLLEHHADPTIGNLDQCMPIHAAAGIGTIAPTEEAGTPEEALAAVTLLLQLGADVNAVDKNGETPMHGAAYKSLPGVVRLLASKGADIAVWNRKNKYGWTPHLIAEGHRPGNFKPSHETLAAIQSEMRRKGVEPPPLTPRKIRRNYD